MKATVFLTYSDESEVCFEYKCDESKENALATLLMLCRGLLMVSLACKISAYDEEGFDLLSYYK